MKKSASFRVAIVIVCGCGFLATGARLFAQGAGALRPDSAARQGRACKVRTTAMSAGEMALVQEDYGKAVDAFTAEMKTAGEEGERAHLGMIRALLAGNKVDEAEAAAKAWLSTSPTDAWAKASLGEVELRKGDIPGAFATLQSAQSADLCIAEMHAGLARIYTLTGMFASAKRLIDSAHALDTVDPAIEEQWIDSEPQQAQVVELGSYMERNAALLTEERKSALSQRQKRLSLAATDTCKLTKPVTSVTIPYYMIQNGSNAYVFWGLQVVIDGKKLNLAEDSTISGILLTRSAAERAHLQAIDGVEVEGIGSASAYSANAARAQSIQIGPLEFGSCDLMVAKDDMRVLGPTLQDAQHLIYLDRGSDGLIGPDAFREFLLTLDKPDRKVKLDPLPGSPTAEIPHLVTGVVPETEPLHDRIIDSSMKDWTRGYRADHFMMFPVRLNQGPVGLYSIATNSRQNTVSLDLARQMKIAGSFAEKQPSMTGHEVDAFRTSAVTVEFLGVREQLEFMNALDMTAWSRNHGVQLTGMMGAPMMDQFTLHLDYRDNLLKIDFDPKKLYSCPPNIRMAGCR